MTPTIEDVLKPPFPEQMTFKEMLEGLFNLDFMTPEEQRTIFDAGEMYANGVLKAASLNRQGWTRVEDGLPEYDELVIVYGQRKLSQPSMGGNPDTVMVGQRMNIKGTGIEKQRERYVDKNEFRQMNYVTHWMPLPNKPI